MIRYIVTISENKGNKRYGIAAMAEERYVDRLEDIVPTFEETVKLAALLQKGGVSAEHFREVVEDYLTVYRFEN